MQRSTANPEPERMARALVVGLALLLVMGGQYALYASPEGLRVGLILSLVGLLLFVTIGLRRPPAWALSLVARYSLSYSALLIGIAAVMSLMATVVDVAFERIDRTNYLPVLLLWAGSAAAYLSAFSIGRRASWADAREWWRTHRREVIGIGAVTLAAAALRFYRLGDWPTIINGDEGLIGQMALETRQNPLANPFALFDNFGGVYLQAIAMAIRAFGQNPFALRLMPAIGGTLAVPSLYLLARRLFGVRVAFIAAGLLAVAHTQVHFSRTVAVAYIQDTWLIPLELFFFIGGLQKRDSLWLAAAGLILGVHFNVYLTAQIIAACLLVYLLVATALYRSVFFRTLRKVPAFWFGFLLTALPGIVYALRYPEEFTVRLQYDGTFQSGWLAREMAATGRGAVEILIGRVAHAVLSLNHYPAHEFYGARIPMLDVITSGLFVLGLAYSLWRTWDHRYLLLNGYFWSVAVAVGVFSIPPGADSYRMLAALPAAILMAAVGLEQVVKVLSFTDDERRSARTAFLGALVAAAALLNLRAYFVDFVGLCRYGSDEETRFASTLGNYLRPFDRETTVYLLRDELIFYGSHGSVDFLSGSLPIVNVSDAVDSLEPPSHSVIVAPPSRIDELRAWAHEHGGGQLQRKYDCENLILLAYEIP